jgi:hypothetical protein
VPGYPCCLCTRPDRSPRVQLAESFRSRRGCGLRHFHALCRFCAMSRWAVFTRSWPARPAGRGPAARWRSYALVIRRTDLGRRLRDAVTETRVPVPAPGPWLARRLFPLLATAGLIATAMVSTIWLGPHLVGKSDWSLPHDLWGTLIAARRLVHLDLSGLYTPPTHLVTLPGAAVILVPVVAIIDAAGLSLQAPGAHNPHPGVWLVAGPYEIALSAVAIFAADAIAERLGVARPKRALLAAAGAVALWSVSARWGHPEDAVAVGLLLFGILALSDSRVERSAWLIGAAVAVQPLVLLTLPIAGVVIEPRRLAGFLARAAAPAVLVLGAAASANWTATVNAVTSQPNSPAVDHPTPWTSFAPHIGNGTVAAGPARVLAILGACGCAFVAGRRWHAERHTAGWSRGTLEEVLWWAAVALALRSVFEPVMVAYYLWPVLAVALIAASRDWSRLAGTSLAAAALTFAAQLPWRGTWTWWTPMVAGLALTLFLARVPRRKRAAPPGALHLTVGAK